MKRAAGYLILLSICLFWSCGQDSNPIDQENTQVNTAQLADPIPYDRLGTQGKIVFQRIGPESNSYEAVGVIDLSTKNTSTLGVNGNGVSVSPDGSKIAYTMLEMNIKNTYLWDTFILSIDGTKKQNISGINGQDQYPSWSNDSKSAFFYMNDVPFTGYIKLYNVVIDQPSVKNIVYDFYNYFPSTHFSESSTGKLLFYAGTPNGYKLFILSSSKYGYITELPSDTSMVKGTLFTPCWSPDGNKIAFVTLKTRWVPSKLPTGGPTGYPAGGRIIIYDVVSNKYNVLYEWDLADRKGDWAGFNQLSVCWSPDGKKLAFNKTKSGIESHIYTINIDGSGLTQITNEPGVCDRSVSWSKF